MPEEFVSSVMSDDKSIKAMHLRRLKVSTFLMAALALLLLVIGAAGAVLLQTLPNRNVNELVELLAMGIGVVAAAGGTIHGTNEWQATANCMNHWKKRLVPDILRRSMALLELVAMAAMILAVYARLLGHALPKIG